ncbi:MAG: NAD(P)-binding domain-containing protein, partial [Chloroflexi bacterium]|nr:NAD(P)-binding domain-containing protein [Chloroflexota bacterium]
MPKAAIVGNGSWGTALGIILARKGIDVKLWTRDQETTERLNRARENAIYLPGFQFPPKLSATHSLEEATEKIDLLILAVPSET